MVKRIPRKMVAAWLREIGVDFVPVPPAAAAAGESLDEIRAELSACRVCALCSGRRTVVFGTGNPKARLMFVGEGPGEEEDRQGEPFVGAAGKRLNHWIARIGLSREEVYIANIVKCRPPGNRAPLPEEAASCLPYLRRQIRAVRPDVLCTLGAVALNILLGNDDRITRARGGWRELDGIPLIPTYHPAYILRNASKEAEVFEDFGRIAEKLGFR